MIFILSPPWGDAFTHKKGLNLLATSPPIDFLVEQLKAKFNDRDIIFAIQTHNKTDQHSLEAVQKLFKNSTYSLIGGLNEESNVGVLIGIHQQMN